MLCLTRRVTQSVLILPHENLDPNTPVKALFESGPIEIVVTYIGGKQAKLGIVAPRELDVIRKELLLPRSVGLRSRR